MKQQGDLLVGSLMVRESRHIATLLLNDASAEVWAEEILTKNILQKKSLGTAARVTRGLKRRLSALDKVLLRALTEADDSLAKQIALTSVLNVNPMLLGFFETVLADAYLGQQESLHLYQWDDYLRAYEQRDPSVAEWSETSTKKVRQIVIRILSECGYLLDTKSRRLQKLVVYPELRQMLEQLNMFEVLNGLTLRRGMR